MLFPAAGGKSYILFDEVLQWDFRRRSTSALFAKKGTEMSKGRNKGRKGIENKIAELEIRKRNGLLRAVASVAGFILIAVLYTKGIQMSSALEGSMVVRGMIYITAMVLAGVCGYGARAWYRADNEIKALRQQANAKKKKK